jgi:hypothetical protein
VLLGTKYTVITVDELPRLTIAGKNRFGYESVQVDTMDTAGIQPRDLHALRSRDVTIRIGLAYDSYVLESSQMALEVDDDELEASPQQI